MPAEVSDQDETLLTGEKLVLADNCAACTPASATQMRNEWFRREVPKPDFCDDSLSAGVVIRSRDQDQRRARASRTNAKRASAIWDASSETWNALPGKDRGLES